MLHYAPITLEKLYFDCVDAQGNAWIGYGLKLQWLWMTLHAHQSLTHLDGVLETHWARTKAASAIQLTPEGLDYACPLFEVQAQPWATPPLLETLYARRRKSIVWHCLYPHAALVVKRDKNPMLAGQGYVERLTMTLPPWQLPIQTLHWGRFVAQEHSLVWIRWQQQAETTHWVFFNGKKIAKCSFSLSQLHLQEENIFLDIQAHKTLVKGRPLDQLGGKLGPIHRLLPQKLRQWTEVKWLAKGTLRVPQQTVTGWVIHEEVHLAGRTCI